MYLLFFQENAEHSLIVSNFIGKEFYFLFLLNSSGPPLIFFLHGFISEINFIG
jgi:hypothetical protein